MHDVCNSLIFQNQRFTVLINSLHVRIVSKVSTRFLCEVTSVVSDSATQCAVACQAPLSMGFPRQEY